MKCCFCNKEFQGMGNDIRPLVTDKGDRCCDECNLTIVVPNRVKLWDGLYGYGLFDKTHKQYINAFGLPIKDISEIMLFETLEKAQHHKDIDYLFDCDIKRVIIREDY